MNNKKSISRLALMLSLMALTNLYAIVPEPAKDQLKPMAFIGATVHVGNGTVIKNALVTTDHGKITRVSSYSEGDDLSFYETLDVNGQHIYPGFILANSQLGLVEVGALRATHDESEMGELNPNIRSIIAYNTDSELIPTLRFNGVLLTQVVPQGGLISGRSSVVELDGWNWQDAAYLTDEGLHLNWPSHWYMKFNFSTFTVEREKNKKFKLSMKQLVALIEQGKAYQQKVQTGFRNIKLAALKNLFNGKMKLYVHTNNASEMVEAIRFSKKMGIVHTVIVGGSEALDVADILVKNEVPVILASIHHLPDNDADSVNQWYQLPAKLVAAGVKVALGYQSNMSARNLPFLAGTAATYGLSKEKALSLITSNVADILGIGKTVGSIEVGKDATFFISSGDALDMRTNNLTKAYIRGKDLDLQGLQQKLYQRYHQKYSHP